MDAKGESRRAGLNLRWMGAFFMLETLMKYTFRIDGFSGFFLNMSLGCKVGSIPGV